MGCVERIEVKGLQLYRKRDSDTGVCPGILENFKNNYLQNTSGGCFCEKSFPRITEYFAIPYFINNSNFYYNMSYKVYLNSI